MTLWKLHRHYKNRLLFVDGGLMNQPNAYLDAMELIEATVKGNLNNGRS